MIAAYVSHYPSLLVKNTRLLYCRAKQKKLKSIYIPTDRGEGLTNRYADFDFEGVDETETRFTIQESLCKFGLDYSNKCESESNGPLERLAIPVVWGAYSNRTHVFIEFPEMGISQRGIKELAEVLSRAAQNRYICIATNSPTLISWLRALYFKGVLGKFSLYQIEKFNPNDQQYRVRDMGIDKKGRISARSNEDAIYDALDGAMEELLGWSD